MLNWYKDKLALSDGHKIVYLSGSVSQDANYYDHFEYVENLLSEKDFDTVNPVVECKNAFPNGAEWSDYIRFDLRLLTYCNAICMLDGWEKSKGATLEKTVADALGFEVMYEKDL